MPGSKTTTQLLSPGTLARQFKSGYWPSHLVDEALGIWEKKPDNQTLSLLLNIQHSIRGFTLLETERLASSILEYGRAISPSIALRLSSILAQLEHDGSHTPAIEKLQKYLQDLSQERSWFFRLRRDNLRAGYPLLLRDLPDSRHSRLARVFCERLIDWDTYTETLQRGNIAIVGNANTELGKQQGQTIDQADHVFRFNNVNTAPAFATDYGSRTSAWVISPAFRPHSTRLASRTVAVSGIEPFHKPTSYWRHLASLPLENIITFPSSVWYQLVGKLEAPPTAGLLTLFSLLHTGIDLSRISVYGMTRDHSDSRQNHYGDRGKKSSRHDWLREAQIMDRLLTELESAAD